MMRILRLAVSWGASVTSIQRGAEKGSSQKTGLPVNNVLENSRVSKLSPKHPPYGFQQLL